MMLEYLIVLLLGFWLGIAIFLYVSCYWLDEILDLPAQRGPSALDAAGAQSGAASGASGAHAQLKRLVARVVEEAASLPALARYAAEPSAPVEPSTYEDLLATAILNKVIERYQAESGSGGRSSGIHSASASPTPSERSSPHSPHQHHLGDPHHHRSQTPLRDDYEDDDDDDDDDVFELNENEAIEDLPKRVPFPEFGGDIVHTTDNEERSFDEVSGSDLQASDGTWEENWLFQKKKIKTIQSVPVPMLVPNSNTDYRVLIGDRDADDTTDLSDNASDAEEDTEYKSDIKRVLDSKHVIGGKTKTDDILDFEPDSLTILDIVDGVEKENDEPLIEHSNVTTENDNTKLEENNDNINEAKNNSVLIVAVDSGPLHKSEFVVEEIHRTAPDKENNDISYNLIQIEQTSDLDNETRGSKDSMSPFNGHEEEMGYEETVAVPVQRYADSLRRRYFEEDEPKSIIIEEHEDEHKEDELIPGSIADRERKKWLNYVEMPNNPYSPEAIQKRLSAKSTSSIFDMLTTSRSDISELDEDNNKIDKPIENHTSINEEQKENKELNNGYDDKEHGLTLNVTTENNENVPSTGPRSPLPRILKDVLAEEVPQYKRYGRDYYIKEAKKSSGARKKSYSETSSLSSLNKSTSLDNFDNELISPGLLIQQFNNIATNPQLNSFTKDDPPSESITTTCHLNNKKNDLLIDYDDATEQTLFAAKAVYISDDTDMKFDEILQSDHSSDKHIPEVNEYDKIDPKSPTNESVAESFISSSDLEDSIKIYNVQTGEIVTCKPRDNLSQDRYDTGPDNNDNIDMPDKNCEEKMEDQNLSDCDGATTVIGSGVETKPERKMSIEELHLPKVRDLARKFVTVETEEHVTSKPPPRRRKGSQDNVLNGDVTKSNKQQYMHSLTARSISKEFREELKMSMATPLKIPGGSNELPEGIEEVSKESSRPGSPLPEPGTLKTKLAFFESLKSKFNSKT